MGRRLWELRDYLQGWVGYFVLVPIQVSQRNVTNGYVVASELVTGGNGVAPGLVSRTYGNSEVEAVTHGISSKGPWVMSSSQAVHEALSINNLTQAGLASLSIWQKHTARK